MVLWHISLSHVKVFSLLHIALFHAFSNMDAAVAIVALLSLFTLSILVVD